MKTKLDFYHMTPFYELNYFIAFIVKLYKRIQQRREQREHRIKDELVLFISTPKVNRRRRNSFFSFLVILFL